MGLFLCLGVIIFPIKGWTSDQNEEIIIIEESDDVVSPSVKEEVEGWKRYFQGGAELRIINYYQMIASNERPIRFLGSFNGYVRFYAADYLTMEVSGLARLPLDMTWQTQVPPQTNSPFIDLAESFLKLRLATFSLKLGNILVPWQVLRGAQLVNRVNPLDLRRGPDFPHWVQGAVPQWGAILRMAGEDFLLEGVLLAQYTPKRGSLAASEQGGIQIARYQKALFRTAADIPTGLLRDFRNASLESTPWFISSSFGFRMQFELLDGEWSITALTSPNDVLSLSSSGRPQGYSRTYSFGLGSVRAFGPFLLKGELVAYPLFKGFGGKTTVLAKNGQFRTLALPYGAFALGLEASYGQWIDASLDIFDAVWFRVPSEPIFGVEQIHQGFENRDVVHRIGVGLVVSGSLPRNQFSWRVQGEVGVVPLDVSILFEFRYRFGPIGFYAGIFSEVFSGVDGSPGWLREKATKFGAMMGYEV